MERERLKQLFEDKAKLSEAIREFFRLRGYLEVETPILVASPDMSPALTPFETELVAADGSVRRGALITSPEFSMKKLLGEGLEKIFTLTKVFRNSDFFVDDAPKQHNPEFTMLEWYQQGMDYQAGMDETEALVKFCVASLGDATPFARVHIPTRFKEITSLDLDTASNDDLKSACQTLGLLTDQTDTWSDLFHRIFVTHIETRLPKTGAFVYDFPKQQAALSRLTPDGKFAERFELYLGGQELCNAFTELTNSTEQRRRFGHEQAERKRLGKPLFPIDEELLRLLPSLRQPTFGNALGVDRLLIHLTGAKSIEDVLAFPARKLFKK